MNLLRKIQYNQIWNIGFCDQTPEDLIQNKAIKSISWLKHTYRDRWFADPFILSVSDDKITVFVEERKIDADKGYLSELVIDRKTFEICERYVILDIDSHLSYPAILRKEGRVFVYPENALGGPLKMYEYDSQSHCLGNPRIILDELVADSTMLEYEGRYYIIATKYPRSQEKAYLYVSNTYTGPFYPVDKDPVQISRACSRPAGEWFVVKNKLFRPAQDCETHYGGALRIMQVDNLSPYNEKNVIVIHPWDFRYNLGVHTINFLDGVTVIDGYGYLFPFWGRVYYGCRKLLKH